MSKSLIQKLKSSLIIVGKQYPNSFGETSFRICGTGFMVDEKYVICSNQVYEAMDNDKTIKDSGPMFVDMFSPTIQLRYIDHDTKRNLCVFEMIDESGVKCVLNSEDQDWESDFSHEIPPQTDQSGDEEVM